MMEYCIVSTRGLDAQRRIVRKICDLMQEGWTPQGGIFCAVNGIGRVSEYMQAMVRTKPASRLVGSDTCNWTMMPLLDEVEG